VLLREIEDGPNVVHGRGMGGGELAPRHRLPLRDWSGNDALTQPGGRSRAAHDDAHLDPIARRRRGNGPGAGHCTAAAARQDQSLRIGHRWILDAGWVTQAVVRAGATPALPLPLRILPPWSSDGEPNPTSRSRSTDVRSRPGAIGQGVLVGGLLVDAAWARGFARDVLGCATAGVASAGDSTTPDVASAFAAGLALGAACAAARTVVECDVS
jgi:hypothetical protein